jgi:hypothetical protein
MKKLPAAAAAVLVLLQAPAAMATNCDTVIRLLSQGYSDAQIAEGLGVSAATVDACARRRTGAFRLNPAGPPPVNAAGPPPINPAGPAPRNPAGPPPLNPAGIPR